MARPFIIQGDSVAAGSAFRRSGVQTKSVEQPQPSAARYEAACGDMEGAKAIAAVTVSNANEANGRP